jgi:hypothetical protein
MSLGEIIISERFCGPPHSGNGGYVSGKLASFIDGSAVVTLRVPPPLNKPMIVKKGEGDKVLLLDGEQLVGEAEPSEVILDHLHQPPTFEEATAASGRTMPPSIHALPTCFVCGPEREEGDALRIGAGPIDPNDSMWQGYLAATWVPALNFAGDDGRVAPEYIWSALDCPTGYTGFKSGEQAPMLLGQFAVAIERDLMAGEHCTIHTWCEKREGRKHFSAGILYGEDGTQVARAKAIWVTIDDATWQKILG